MGTLPLTALRSVFDACDLEGVFGTGGTTLSSSVDSGVVDLVEMDNSDEIELILPHVFDELDDGSRVGGKGFAFDFVGEDGLVEGRVCDGVLGVAFVGNPGTAALLEGEEGSWFAGKSSFLYASFCELAEAVSSMR